MTFTSIETLLLAGMALLLGHYIHRFLPWTAKYNLPSSVLGGFVFAIVFLIVRQTGGELNFSEELKGPMMLAFFASLGFSASVSRLLAGGKPLLIFFLATCFVLVVQDVVGVLFAVAIGQSPLFGLMTSSVSLVGGPGTALAFAPAFEAAGMENPGTIGLAAALGGIVCAGLFGGPLSTHLINKFNLTSPYTGRISVRGEEIENYSSDQLTGQLLRNLFVLVVAMVLGSYIGTWFNSVGITLPGYIGSMIVAATLRNLDDKTKWIQMRESWLDSIGSVALSIFIAMSMMTLDFMKLQSFGAAIAGALAVQVVVLLIAARYLVFPMLQRNYEAAVLAGGLYGFMMGTVANAMANIETIQRSKGPAPHAGLYISLVGACFIDFVNAGVITVFLNIFGNR